MYRDLPDFDTLLTLNEENPEELEKIRLELTDAIFERVSEPSRKRLEGLQFRINMELQRAKTAQARCVKMSSMMHDSFIELQQVLRSQEKPKAQRNAQVISLEQYNQRHKH